LAPIVSRSGADAASGAAVSSAFLAVDVDPAFRVVRAVVAFLGVVRFFAGLRPVGAFGASGPPSSGVEYAAIHSSITTQVVRRAARPVSMPR
jgi:hypothetical protein